MRRSAKAIDKTATERAVWGRWAAPDPGLGVAIELGGSDAGDVGDIVVVSQGLTGKRFAAKDAPPAFNEMQPCRPDRDAGVLDARMRGCADARMRGCAASHSRIGPLL
jgi:hypothetical protein